MVVQHSGVRVKLPLHSRGMAFLVLHAGAPQLHIRPQGPSLVMARDSTNPSILDFKARASCMELPSPAACWDWTASPLIQLSLQQCLFSRCAHEKAAFLNLESTELRSVRRKHQLLPELTDGHLLSFS